MTREYIREALAQADATAALQRIAANLAALARRPRRPALVVPRDSMATRVHDALRRGVARMRRTKGESNDG